MPPKKRAAKTTRRTPRSTLKSKSRAPSSTPPPDPEPTTPPSSSSALEKDCAAAETPYVAAAEESTVFDATPIPEADAPAAEPVDAREAVQAAPEAVESEPSAAPEAMEAEPVAHADEAPQPIGEPAAAPKIATRVRKVVKKRIVVKRVPKGTLAAAAPKEESGPQEAVEQNPNPEPETKTEKPISVAAVAETPIPAHPEEAQVLEKHEDTPAAVPVEEDEVEKKVEASAGPMEEETPVAEVEVGDEEKGISERRRRRKTEIFIGGLERDAKEEDIRKVFGTIGEIVEVRMMMDSQTGKNKGYAFLRYADPAQAKRAIKEFVKVEVCGKLCGAAALEGNDTIFLGNIDKKWKKEDVIKLLEEIGIEKIDTVTVMSDPNNVGLNRGFAFLELETNKDAQYAYKKLQKKDVFGKGRNIKVAWAEPLNDPDDEEMQKVKSVYAEGIPPSWDEEKLWDTFKKYGDIERVVLSRNIKSAKRKDFAFINYTTRAAALSCIETFDQVELTDNGSKVNVNVSLAKPVQKGKQSKASSKFSNKDNVNDKPKGVQYTKASVSSSKGNSVRGGNSINGGERSFTTHELPYVQREQASWKQGQISYARGLAAQDYTHALHGGKRTFSSLGDDALYSDLRGYARPRMDGSYPSAGLRYDPMSHSMSGSSLPYYQQPGAGYQTGDFYGASDRSSTFQTRQGAAPYGSGYHSRY